MVLNGGKRYKMVRDDEGRWGTVGNGGDGGVRRGTVGDGEGRWGTMRDYGVTMMAMGNASQNW